MVKPPPRNKNTFAYFSYPIARESVRMLWPLSRIMPDAYLTNNHSFKVFPLKGLKDAQGNQVQGYYITRLYLKERFENDAFKADALHDAQEAARIAHALGAKILGLGGFPASASEHLARESRLCPVPITSGNALLAWSVFESMYWACRQKKIKLSRTKLAVLGADSSLGILCSKKFAGLVSHLVLSGSGHTALQALKEQIAQRDPVSITIEDDMRKAVKEADLVIACYNQPGEMFSGEDMHPGGIVCDISWCGFVRNAFKPSHGCVLVKSGLVKLPHGNNFSLHAALGRNVICASLAEVILLALENRYLAYAQGGNTNLDKLEEIADRAAAHGFEMWYEEKTF